MCANLTHALRRFVRRTRSTRRSWSRRRSRQRLDLLETPSSLFAMSWFCSALRVGCKVGLPLFPLCPGYARLTPLNGLFRLARPDSSVAHLLPRTPSLRLQLSSLAGRRTHPLQPSVCSIPLDARAAPSPRMLSLTRLSLVALTAFFGLLALSLNVHAAPIPALATDVRSSSPLPDRTAQRSFSDSPIC